LFNLRFGLTHQTILIRKEARMTRFFFPRYLAVLALTLTPAALQAQVVFEATGANSAAIQSTVDAFRTDLGTLNANVAGSFGSGRREINWDGVPSAASAPNSLPANFFNSNSPRGVIFSTPGSGFQVSGATTDAGIGQPAAANFGNIDPTYTNTFTTFTPQRLFTGVGSNIVDVNFFIPGSNTPALVQGFGAVFTDVDLAMTSSIQFFDSANVSLGNFFVPAATGSATLSFLGVAFSVPEIARVRITSGNIALGAGVSDQNGNLRDVVVMDDFIYGEPVLAAAVPELGTTAFLLGLSCLGLTGLRRLRPFRAG
jgi:hypothetical protein